MKQDVQVTRTESTQSLAVLHASMDLNSQLISSMALQKHGRSCQ